jgi:hypothetical protein
MVGVVRRTGKPGVAPELDPGGSGGQLWGKGGAEVQKQCWGVQ